MKKSKKKYKKLIKKAKKAESKGCTMKAIKYFLDAMELMV